MSISALNPGERVADVSFTEDSLPCPCATAARSVCLWLGIQTSARHSCAAKSNWKIAGGGYGIHWPDIDEDLSTEGLLRGAPAPHEKPKV